MMHFEVACVYDVSYRSKLLLFFAYGYPVVSAPFVKITNLFMLSCLDIFVKNQLSIHMWVYFWTLNSVSLMCVSILMPTVYLLPLGLCSKF